ncbi:MAG: PIN domain-containing protein [Ornithinimicrobium sp.]
MDSSTVSLGWARWRTPQAPVRMVVPERGSGTTFTVASVFLDTNVIAYRFDGSEPQEQSRAHDMLGLDHDFAISTQVMLELHSVLTRKLRPRLSLTKARNALDLLADLTVVTADALLVRRAAVTCERHELSIWDAMIVQAAAEAGCEELWSEDVSADSSVLGVKVVDPFAQG